MSHTQASLSSCGTDISQPNARYQIVKYDSYQSVPTKLDKQYFTLSGQKVEDPNPQNDENSLRLVQVPVIRVYAKTTSGHSCLIHLHNVFPYIYIPYKGSLESQEKIDENLWALKSELDRVLTESFRRENEEEDISNKRKGGNQKAHTNSGKKRKKSNPNIQSDDAEISSLQDESLSESDEDEKPRLKYKGSRFIADLTLVKSIPFYGFHGSYQAFIKVSIVNPRYASRLTRLLHDGKIYGKFIQPYESHIPYTLQFLCDYNIFSSDFLKVSATLWRSPVIQLKKGDTGNDYEDYFESELWKFNKDKFDADERLHEFLKTSNIRPSHILDESEFPRISRTLFEIDITSDWIENRRLIVERDIHNGFQEFQPDVKLEASNEKYMSSTREILKDVSYQLSLKNLKPQKEWKLFESSPERKVTGAKWVEHEQHLSMLDYCKEMSWNEFLRTNRLSRTTEPKITDISLLTKLPKLLETVPRSFESVELLQHKVILPQDNDDSGHTLSLLDYILKQVDSHSRLSNPLTSQFNGSIIEGFDEEESESDGEGAPSGPEENINHSEHKTKMVDNGEDTDDDLDDFVGSIPHLNDGREDDFEEKENEQSETNEEDGDVTKPDAISTSLIDDDLRAEDIDQKFFQLTQKKVPSKVFSKPLTVGKLTQELFDVNCSSLSSSFVNNSSTRLSLGRMTHRLPNKSTSSTKSSFFSLGAFEDLKQDDKVYEFEMEPIVFQSQTEFLDDLELNCGAVRNEYPDPFYSKPLDAKGPFYFAGKKFVLKSTDISSTLSYQLALDITRNSSSTIMENMTKITRRLKEPTVDGTIWRHLAVVPTFQEVQKWCESNPLKSISDTQMYRSQIKPVTQNLKGYKYASYEKSVSRQKSVYMKFSMLVIEIHVNTRGRLFPDPMIDEVAAIFWKFDPSDDSLIENTGIFIVDKSESNMHKWSNISPECPIQSFKDEVEMIKQLVFLVEALDPDILAGYEIHSMSWGYILERFAKYHEWNLSKRLSRVSVNHGNKSSDRWGYTHGSSIRIGGRHMLNIWRHLRGDLALQNYTIENVAFHSLHIRIPKYSHSTLTSWFTSGQSSLLAIGIAYYLKRLNTELEIVIKQELIPRTTEQSRLLGIDFYSILDRGSQYKVESLMVRMTKPENFILISPSKKQVFKQDALQVIPLILEPESSFYKSPLVVLDFQSLYPSILIAYNYCYSTMLGKLQGFDAKKFQRVGITSLKLPPGILKLLEEYISISPNGTMFFKENVRKSLLAKFLTEILDARIMVKSSMGKLKDDKELMKLYHNKQLALKLIANVTYGYTSATFSGRMPCSDIADAIVSSARETLLKALDLIESNEKWGARIVYGDTDSLFVYLPGKSKADAFKIGKEMAAAVTEVNPAPVKLKFEKVYFPSVLLAKKRYVGYSYEYEDQKVPKFDAKGIETVRRDGIPAQQKIVEKSLRILFETSDLSRVKEYVTSQFYKIMSGDIAIQDFCFSKEVRLGSYKDNRYAPPGAQISMANVAKDHRSEPQYRERVAYLVIQGAPNQILRERCISPDDFIERQSKDDLALDWNYYITKVLIPPLERIFNIMGVDIKQWYKEMPHIDTKARANFRMNNNGANTTKKSGLASIYQVIQIASCINCGDRLTFPMDTLLKTKNDKLCHKCLKDELNTILAIQNKLRKQEKEVVDVLTVCRECTKRNFSHVTKYDEATDNCSSLECPMYYTRVRAIRKLATEESQLRELLEW